MARRGDNESVRFVANRSDGSTTSRRGLGRPAAVIALLLLTLCCPTVRCRAADPGEATSDSMAREEALRAVPWAKLSPEDLREVQFITRNASIYRRLPSRIIDCDPDLFSFLAQHPEVVVETWRIMGISRATLQRTPSGALRGADGAGTTGDIRFPYADWGPKAENLVVVVADGAYEGKPLVAPVRAQTVMLLRSTSIQETNGRHYVTVRVDSFIHIDRLGIELVAKTLHPWIAKTADHNFVETLSFVSNFSRTAEQNPTGMQRLASRFQAVDEPTRQELVQLCFQTADRWARLQRDDRLSSDLLARRRAVSLTTIK